MIRGTTPTLEFTLPFSTDLLADGWVTIAQNKEVIIDKQLSTCQCAENKLIVKLTQEETLKLEDVRLVEIQLRVKTHAGEALASEIMHDDAQRILREGVI